MSDSIIKIAVADDAMLVRAGIVGLIKMNENCKVILEAENGKKLIDKLSMLEQLPDICIIETNNDILHSYKTLIDLRQSFPEIKILALSFYDLEYTIIKMIQHGIRGYVLKTCSSDQLHAAIRDLHTTGHHYTEVAPEKLFEKARKEILLELTAEELKLLSVTANKFRSDKLSIEDFVQENIDDNLFHPIIMKLMLSDRSGLVYYMMQIGLVYPRHLE